MTEEDIKAHWPIFTDWYLKSKGVGYMPSGAMLIAGWYEYCQEYSNYEEKHKNEPIIAPETSEAPDD